jgi:hypothetical protein
VAVIWSTTEVRRCGATATGQGWWRRWRGWAAVGEMKLGKKMKL